LNLLSDPNWTPHWALVVVHVGEQGRRRIAEPGPRAPDITIEQERDRLWSDGRGTVKSE